MTENQQTGEPDEWQLTIELPDKPLVFHSVDEMAEWAHEPRSIWEHAEREYDPNNIIAEYKNLAQSIANQADAIIAHMNDGLSPDKHVQQFTKQVHTYYSGIYITDRDRLYPLLLAMKEAEEWAQMSALCLYKRGISINLQNAPPAAMAGFMRAMAHDGRLPEIVAPDREYIKKKIDSAVRRSAKFKATLEEFRKAIGEDKNTIKEAIEGHAADVLELIAQGKKDLKDLEAKYNEKLSLEKSTHYWGKKRAKHRNVAWWSLIVFFLIAGGGGWAIWELASDLVGIVPSGDADVTNAQILFAIKRLATVGIIASLLAWILRIISRLMMSEFHQMSDAAERETMVYTYLAMLHAKDNPVTEDERELCLQAIFRQGSSGLIQSDAVPSQIVQLYPVKE